MSQAFNRTTFFGLLKAADTAVLTLQEYVSKHGMERAAVGVEVVHFVAKEQGLETREGQRGLTFVGTKAQVAESTNRRDYLMRLIYNVPKSGKGKSADTSCDAKIATAAKAVVSEGVSDAKAIAAFKKQLEAARKAA